MIKHPLNILILAFAPLALRSLLYYLSCKIRSIHISIMSCIVLGGSGMLLAVIPIPLPPLIVKVAAIGLAIFLMSRYTEAEVYPDLVFIPLAVEVVAGLLTVLLLSPLAVI